MNSELLNDVSLGRGEEMPYFDSSVIQDISTDVGKTFVKELSRLLEELKPGLVDIEKTKIEAAEEHISVSLPHKTNRIFDLNIDFGKKESTIFFANSHFHLEFCDDNEQRIDEIINVVAKIMSNLIEVHTHYKGKRVIKIESFFVSNSGELELFQDTKFTYNYLLFLNPFLRKRKVIDRGKFS